jgi:protoporphyrinogen/coproporphyrinogen III oxidase
MKVTILGGGITGLTLAYLLQDTFDVTLIEKTDRLGGWIQTVEKNGFLFELGPRGFRPLGEGKATLELCQKLGLQPLPCNKSAKKRFVLSNNKLNLFGLPYLLKCGLISSLWKDLWVKNGKRADESLESFFLRHLHPKMVEGVLDPIVKGIFGGELRALSIESCFPALKMIEEESGSLILGRERKKREKLPALYSFEGGMETLPKEITKQLRCKIKLNTCVEDINKLDADILISTLPLHITGELFGHPYPLPMQSLTTISCGWHGEILPKSGFGYLVPKKEKRPYLGMTWDSFIFAQPFYQNQSRICVMCEGLLSEDEALDRAKNALMHDLKMDIPPAVSYVHQTPNAISHFPIEHKAHVENWKQKLPSNIFVCGSSVEGKGVNGCILQAKNLALWLLMNNNGATQ